MRAGKDGLGFVVLVGDGLLGEREQRLRLGAELAHARVDLLLELQGDVAVRVALAGGALHEPAECRVVDAPHHPREVPGEAHALHERRARRHGDEAPLVFLRGRRSHSILKNKRMFVRLLLMADLYCSYLKSTYFKIA